MEKVYRDFVTALRENIWIAGRRGLESLLKEITQKFPETRKGHIWVKESQDH